MRRVLRESASFPVPDPPLTTSNNNNCSSAALVVHTLCSAGWITTSICSHRSTDRSEAMPGSHMSVSYSIPSHQRRDTSPFHTDSLYVQTNGRMSQPKAGCHTPDQSQKSGPLVDTGSFVLLLFSVVLLGSGSAILITIIMRESPATSVIRSHLLPVTHPLSILFYSLILSASVMCCTAFVIILSTCCRRSAVSEKAHRTEMVVLNSRAEEYDSDMALTAEFLQSESLPRNHNGHHHSHRSNGNYHNGMNTQSKTLFDENDSSGRIRDQSLRRGREAEHVSEWSQNRDTITKSSVSSAPSCFFCFLIFMLLFLLTIQLTVSFIGFVSSPSLQTLSNEANQTSFSESLFLQTSETPAHFLRSQRMTFDKIERLLRCCGLREYTDYNNNEPVPDSCCRSPAPACGRRKHPSNIFYEGCIPRIMQNVREDMTTLSALSLEFSTVAAAGLFLSCYFYVRLISDHSRHSVV